MLSRFFDIEADYDAEIDISPWTEANYRAAQWTPEVQEDEASLLCDSPMGPPPIEDKEPAAAPAPSAVPDHPGDADVIGGMGDDGDDAKFQFHSRSVFLTYADVETWFKDAKDMASDIYNIWPDDIKHLVIGWEKYKEQGTRWHAHVYIEFIHKKRTSNPRYFDLYDLHPHIQSAKQKNKVIGYCSKSAHHGWPYFNDIKPDLSHFQGFDRKMADYNKWTVHLQNLTLTPFTFPVTFYGRQFNLDFNTKKRHFWIHGPPNMGKSSRAGSPYFDTLGINYFEPGAAAPGDKTGYGTFDLYQGQELIIWEDKNIEWPVIQVVTDYNGMRPKTLIRGRGKDPIFTKRMVVVITSNYAPGAYNNQDWCQDIPAFLARFNVIEIEAGVDGQGKIKDVR